MLNLFDMLCLIEHATRFICALSEYISTIVVIGLAIKIPIRIFSSEIYDGRTQSGDLMCEKDKYTFFSLEAQPRKRFS